MNDHAIFAAMSQFARFSAPGDLHGLRGSRWTAGHMGLADPVPVTGAFVPAPPLGEEYFEWIALLESCRAAKDRYVMYELGAGYGRWGVRAGAVAKSMGIPDIDIRFVEAEPQHVIWLREEVAANDFDDIKTSVIEGAVSYAGAPVLFAVDFPEQNLRAGTWFGQAVIGADGVPEPEQTYHGKRVYRSSGGYGQIYVDAVTLEAVTADIDRIDLIDMDLQGAEKELIEHAIGTLTAKCRLVHIGTHGVDIEDAIRAVFRENGWLCQYDFSLQGLRDTPFGPVRFDDGVQTWLNARFA